MSYPSLQKFPHFAYDTETTSLQYPTARVFGFSISTPDGKDHYWDIRETPKAVDWFNDQMAKYKGTIICHNASFDHRMSYATGIDLPISQLDCTVIRASCINEHEHSYGLDKLCSKYLGVGKQEDIYEKLAELFGGIATRNVQMPRLHKAPSSLVSGYAKTDTRRALELWQWQNEEIKRQNLHDIIRFERDLMPTFIRAEMRGIRVDLDYAEQAMAGMDPIIYEMQQKLNDEAGWDMNVNSGPQIHKLFKPTREGDTWVANDGTKLGTTGAGEASFGAEFLREMVHPAASMILDIRSALKTRDTFLKKHVLEHAIEGRVYPTVSQTKSEYGGAGTGRVQYSDPAMQQIPSRNKEVAAIVKPCFLPDEGNVWVDCDKASFEVRVFFHLVNNPSLIAEYAKNPNNDAHQMVADMTGLVRNATYNGQPNAKQLNLSMIFNQGNGATAAKMGMPYTWETFMSRRDGQDVTYQKAGPEAMEIINLYHERFPGVKELAEECKEEAERNGFITTYTGRHLRFPNGWKTYKASGIKIQATAADINKENWKIIEEQLGSHGHLILNTHDSYSLSLPEEWESHFDRVKSAIERPVLNVPLILELSGAGRNWWSALNGELPCRK